MDFKQLRRMAQRQIDKRGGNEVAKEDLKELQDIAKGKGTLGDKAKRAAEALKTPGREEPPTRS